MKSNDFTKIAARYEQDSLIQKSAAEKLIGLLDIKRNDDVLDLGCGTGSLARRMRALTDGRVAGIDPSEGMVREAKANRNGKEITFAQGRAEELAFRDAFSVIFCNSAFQWFRDIRKALANCHQALRQGGRMGLQAPARKDYCPNFLRALDDVAADKRTAGPFAGFTSPWLFLDSADEYAALFCNAGFSVPFAKLETLTTRHSPDEVMTIFESGAAAGYLNQEFYQAPIDGAYMKTFRELVKGSFVRQAGKDGQVELTFNRIYLLAVK